MTDQKVAIVTGASSGIGRATAVALAKQGVKVTVAARRAKEGEETVHLVKEAGSEGIFVKTDVANEDNVKSLVEKTVKMYDRLDYAFNNAAIPEITTPLIEQTSATMVFSSAYSSTSTYKKGIRSVLLDTMKVHSIG